MLDLKQLHTIIPQDQPPRRVERMWRVVEAGSRAVSEPNRRFRFALIAAVGAALGVVALVSIMVVPDVDRGPLSTEAGAPVPINLVAVDRVTHRFDDGSSIELEKGSTLRVVENTGADVRFTLGGGKARFTVKPGGSRTWRVEVGGLTVTVLGTRFSVEKVDARISIAVERGTVSVRGKGVGGDRTLAAGNTLSVNLNDEQAVHRETAPVESTPLPTPLPKPPPKPMEDGGLPLSAAAPESVSTTPESGPGSLPKNRWKVHAAAGDFEEAYDALGAEGVADLTLKSKSIDELLMLADAARLSGHPSEAVAPLKTIIQKYPKELRAGTAAYTLGKLYLLQLHNPHKAAKSFDLAIELGLPTVLLETAYFNKAEALFQISRPLGEWALNDYAKRYPDGRYLKQLESRRGGRPAKAD